jgi:enoyl-CoA hydratase
VVKVDDGSDVRVGTAGDFDIGMDWVALGVPVPDLAVELARVRLSPRHMTRACNTARLYNPDEAVEAGFLDFVTVDDTVEQACEVAADLAERLDPQAFEVTRITTCRSLTDAIMRAAGDLWRLASMAFSGECPNQNWPARFRSAGAK